MTQIQSQPEVQALWDKLERFQLSEDHAVFDFAARLARENGWSHAFSGRVIYEYKRFLLLTRCAGHSVTPSEEVDQAWHLHLVYTRSYWEKLCGEVLERPLHHEPTSGGEAEEAKYRQQYQNTLDSYARLFGEPAPTDIWPSVEKRFQPMRSRWVDVSRHWLLPKPSWVKWVNVVRLQQVVLGLVGVVVLVGCQPLLSVFDLHGDAFLQFYLMGLGMACLLSWLLIWMVQARAGRISELPLDPYDIAFIGGGRDRVVDVGLTVLYAKKLLRVESGTSGMKLKVDPSTPVPQDLHEIEAKLLMLAQVFGRPEGLSTAMHSKLGVVRERLTAQGWLLSPQTYAWHRWLAVLPLIFLIIVGLIKVFVGLSRDRPVGFMVVLLLVSVVFLLFRFHHVSHLTSLGKGIWAKLKKKTIRSESVGQSSPGDVGPIAQIAMAVALGGYAALNSSGYWPLHSALKRPVQGMDFGGSGWSSSSSCGSSCGSGCGSSGCGGCGGGGD